MTYDANSVRSYFDALGSREWERLEATLQGRANYAVHKRIINQHVQPGMRVLDIGAGPGRFAIDLVALGAQVIVADISPVQLNLARQRLEDSGLLQRVAGFRQLDVLDMHSVDDESFDVVVCFGGAVSYTRERHLEALRELARVVRPGGALLVSVMSLYGAMRLIGSLDAASVLETIDQHLDWRSVLGGAGVLCTHAGSREFHQPIALFTSRGLIVALTEAGFDVQRIASATPILTQYFKIPNLDASSDAAAKLIELEVALCDCPGLADAGGHVIAVAQRQGR
jgi:ubiquinone/menaquinone biosynthesis C-methylase UbiE